MYVTSLLAKRMTTKLEPIKMNNNTMPSERKRTSPSGQNPICRSELLSWTIISNVHGMVIDVYFQQTHTIVHMK